MAKRGARKKNPHPTPAACKRSMVPAGSAVAQIFCSPCLHQTRRAYLWQSAAETHPKAQGPGGALFRGTHLALVPECRPQPPQDPAGLVAAEGCSWRPLRCAPLPWPGSFNR